MKIDWKEFKEMFNLNDEEGYELRLETTVRFGSRDTDGNIFPVSKIAIRCAKLIMDTGNRRQLWGLNVFALLTPRMHDDLKELALKAAFDRFPFEANVDRSSE